MLTLFTGAPSVAAQQKTQWSSTHRIPGYGYAQEPPYLVADHNQTVHAFSSQRVDDDILIAYSQWSIEKGWTTPVDILLSPSGQARITGAFLDKDGIIHLTFFGGDDIKADIYYAKTFLVDAARPQAWSSPVIVGHDAVTPTNAAMASDDNGNIVVVYSGKRDGTGLYEAHTTNSGSTWTTPDPIFLTYSSTLWPFFLQMNLGESGVLHAVWNVVDESGANVDGYYTRLVLDKWQWDDVRSIDNTVGLGIAIPSIIEHKGIVYLVYNNGLLGTVAPVQWVKRSFDSGISWTEPVRPFPDHIGRNGVMSFVVDSSDTLHLFFGQRIPKGGVGGVDLHGMWHSVWQENEWTYPEAVISGPQVPGFDPYDARAVVSQGNTIFVTWRTDPGMRDNPGVWYSFSTFPVPEFPATPLPSKPTDPVYPTDDNFEGVSSNSISSEDSISSTTEEKEFSNLLANSDTPLTANPILPLFIAMIPVLLLVGITIFSRLIHFASR